MRHDPLFTYEQFAGDVKDNALKVLKSRIGTFSSGEAVVFNLSVSEDVNAKALKVAPEQYMIVHCTGLAKRLFEDSLPLAQNCLEIFPAINATHNLLARLIAGCSSEMVFWHEYAHLARGHLAFLKSKAVGDAVNLYERSQPEAGSVETEEALALRRFVEIDADIYAAEFLFARALTCMRARTNAISNLTWMIAYVMGIRSMYEAIYDPSENVLSSESDHPHSIARAYTAIAHGVATSLRLGLSSADSGEWMRIAVLALDQYERNQNRGFISEKDLKTYMEKDLSYWRSLEPELIPFQMISKSSHSSVLQQILNRFR